MRARITTRWLAGTLCVLSALLLSGFAYAEPEGSLPAEGISPAEGSLFAEGSVARESGCFWRTGYAKSPSDRPVFGGC